MYKWSLYKNNNNLIRFSCRHRSRSRSRSVEKSHRDRRKSRSRSSSRSRSRYKRRSRTPPRSSLKSSSLRWGLSHFVIAEGSTFWKSRRCQENYHWNQRVFPSIIFILFFKEGPMQSQWSIHRIPHPLFHCFFFVSVFLSFSSERMHRMVRKRWKQWQHYKQKRENHVLVEKV